jgi:hypothetical protein
VDRAGIQPGEPIRSDVTPILWPRPGGASPAPPPPVVAVHPSLPGWRPGEKQA